MAGRLCVDAERSLVTPLASRDRPAVRLISAAHRANGWIKRPVHLRRLERLRQRQRVESGSPTWAVVIRRRFDAVLATNSAPIISKH